LANAYGATSPLSQETYGIISGAESTSFSIIAFGAIVASLL
jgi:hypothetical protein